MERAPVEGWVVPLGPGLPTAGPDVGPVGGVGVAPVPVCPPNGQEEEEEEEAAAAPEEEGREGARHRGRRPLCRGGGHSTTPLHCNSPLCHAKVCRGNVTRGGGIAAHK